MDTNGTRRIHEPVAWVLLIIATAGLVIGFTTLTGLRGGPGAGAASFQQRAVLGLEFFNDVYVAVPPILAVLLVSLGGQLARRAGHLALLAAAVQALTVGLGVISLIAALGPVPPPAAPVPPGEVGSILIRPGLTGGWAYLGQARGLAVAAAGLILSLTVAASAARRGRAGHARLAPD